MWGSIHGRALVNGHCEENVVLDLYPHRKSKRRSRSVYIGGEKLILPIPRGVGGGCSPVGRVGAKLILRSREHGRGALRHRDVEGLNRIVDEEFRRSIA